MRRLISILVLFLVSCGGEIQQDSESIQQQVGVCSQIPTVINGMTLYAPCTAAKSILSSTGYTVPCTAVPRILPPPVNGYYVPCTAVPRILPASTGYIIDHPQYHVEVGGTTAVTCTVTPKMKPIASSFSTSHCTIIPKVEPVPTTTLLHNVLIVSYGIFDTYLWL